MNRGKAQPGSALSHSTMSRSRLGRAEQLTHSNSCFADVRALKHLVVRAAGRLQQQGILPSGQFQVSYKRQQVCAPGTRLTCESALPALQVCTPALPFRQANYALDPVTGLYTVPFKQILRVRLLLDSGQLERVSCAHKPNWPTAAAMLAPLSSLS